MEETDSCRKKHTRCRRHLVKMGIIAFASAIWIIIRTGRKPSRITYPCQQAALANINGFLIALGSLELLEKLGKASKYKHSWRLVVGVVLATSLLIAFDSATITSDFPSLPAISSHPILLDLRSQSAANTIGSSDLFFIENASGIDGSLDQAVSALVQLMENHSLHFYKTVERPDGLIGKDDVVLIKVNCQWPERGGTNTDLVRSVIRKILFHPEGFTGEVVVADNGQGVGSLDWENSNSFKHNQSMQDVVDMFSSYKVSGWLWDQIDGFTVGEYDQGDFRGGYILNHTRDPVTRFYVSYPKFMTRYGTYISLKKGLWSNETSSYDTQRLKIINMPVLKSHVIYGVTACVKHYMGVPSNVISYAHGAIRHGAMGTEMVETRFPTLNILDAIWINPNPLEGGNRRGPQTPYEYASFANIVAASTDPVALDYWTSKHILVPAAIQLNYSVYSSLDPDYEPISEGPDPVFNMLESFHNYLERSMNVIKNAGLQATMNETEMNVYVTKINELEEHDVAISSIVPDHTWVYQGHDVSFNVTVRNKVACAETVIVTLYCDQESDQTIDSQIVELLEQESRMLVFRWDTTAVECGRGYLISAMAVITSDSNLTDNTVADGIVAVRIYGDIDGDNVVNGSDIVIVTQAFGSYPEHPRWNPDADINEDNVVDGADVVVVARNFGRHAP